MGVENHMSREGEKYYFFFFQKGGGNKYRFRTEM
jgi:hypothetical protein